MPKHSTLTLLNDSNEKVMKLRIDEKKNIPYIQIDLMVLEIEEDNYLDFGLQIHDVQEKWKEIFRLI